MELRYRAHSSFDAHHVDDLLTRCSRSHGHHFEVTVEEIAEHDNDLERNLRVITLEWSDRSLNEMIPGSVTSVSLTRIAAWVAERLALVHPKIVRVEVSDGQATGIAYQEPRR